jgi:hypothetical protein
MLSALRKFARKNLILRKFVGYHMASSGLFDSFFRNYEVSPAWQKRIDLVMSSSDNAFIPKVESAGTIKSGKQIMHNGIQIRLGSYYGPEYSQMLMKSQGVHEPQEERIFMEVLKSLPANALMIEMGAFWSFYSMWFQKNIKGAVNIMVEPDAFNLGHGKRNFNLNNMKGEFIQAFVGEKSQTNENGRTVCVDGLVEEYNIDFIHVLHSDIQGYEGDMLKGAEKTFSDGKIGYIFISTHSQELHYSCLDFLKEKKFIVIASADMNETYSEDGLIVARAPQYPGIGPIDISKRNA